MKWTIEINGTERKYKNISFERKLDMVSPTKFDATIQYYNDINFMDTVQIKRDGYTEWKGYVESIEVTWDSNGRYLNLKGRDVSVILWKKYIEDFSNMTEKTYGFFGRVNAIELIKFLCRTPVSDDVASYPSNKEGWGIATQNADGTLRMSCNAYRTAFGHPDFALMRRRGYEWRNSGEQNYETLVVDAVVSNSWNTHGTSPYLHNDDNNDYIYSTGHVGDSAIFSFSNLNVNLSSLKNVNLRVRWKPDFTYWAWIRSSYDCYIWIESTQTWQYLFTAYGKGGFNNPWQTSEVNLTDFLTTISDINNAKIKFVEQSNALASLITYACLSVTYMISGEQNTSDWFEVNFPKQSVTGIYIESRTDNDSYPRNYRILNADNITISPWNSSNGWVEVDPNNHISLDSSQVILTHDNYPLESAFYYKDYGSNVATADWKFSFKISDSENAPHAFIPFCLSSYLGNLYSQENDSSSNLIALIISNVCGSLSLYCENKQGANSSTTSSLSLTLDKMYYVHFTKNGTDFTISIFNDEKMNNDSLLAQWVLTTSGDNLRYRYQALTYGESEFAIQFSDGFESTLINWTRYGLVGDVNTSYSDDRVEGLKSFSIEASENGGAYVEKEFGSSNECYTDFYVKLPDVPHESLEVNLVPNSFISEHSDWFSSTGNKSSDISSNDGDSSYIYLPNNLESEGKYDQHWEFSDLNSKYRAIKLNSAIISVICRGNDNPTNTGAATIRVYIDFNDGNGYQYMGYIWSDSNGYVERTIAFSSELLSSMTIEKINAMKLKLVYYDCTYVADSNFRITQVKVHLSGTGYFGYVTLAKIYDKDVNGTGDKNVALHGALELRPRDSSTNQNKWYVVIYGHAGTYWEVVSDYTLIPSYWHRLRLHVLSDSSAGFVKAYYLTGDTATLICEKTSLNSSVNGTPDCFNVEAVCYDLAYGTFLLDYARLAAYTTASTHTLGEIHSLDINYGDCVLAECQDNIFRDIIHSWSPVETSRLRIEITKDDSHAWAISQVYVYKTQDKKYRAFLDGESEPSPPPPYAGGPYIKNIVVDSEFDVPVGPLNISRQRLLDAIYFVVEKCYQESGELYAPYEWWISYDNNNTLHIANRHGTDKSATIQFVTGEHLSGVKREKYIEDTAQKVYIVGRGEQKTQQDVSKWVSSESAMDNIRTFYEAVESEKSISDPSVAEIVGKVYLYKNAPARDQITAYVSKDIYASGSYDVGDTIKIVDTLTDTNGNFRLMNIEKDIDENGEQVTFTLGYPKYRDDDEFALLMKQIKNLATVGVLMPDWTQNGTDDVNAEQIDKTSEYKKSVTNKEATPKGDIRDIKWGYNPTLSNFSDFGNTSDPNAQLVFEAVHGRTFVKSNEEFKLYGPTSGGTQPLTVYIQNEFIKMVKDPVLTLEFALNEDEPNLRYWTDGDYIILGLRNETSGVGFWFKIVKQGGVFPCYAEYNLTGNSEDTESTFLTYLESNHKYKIIIQKEADVKDKNGNIIFRNNNVIYNLYDLDDENNPIRSSMCHADNLSTMEVRPLYMYLSAYGTSNHCRAVIYFYNYSTKWTVT